MYVQPLAIVSSPTKVDPAMIIPARNALSIDATNFLATKASPESSQPKTATNKAPATESTVKIKISMFANIDGSPTNFMGSELLNFKKRFRKRKRLKGG